MIAALTKATERSDLDNLVPICEALHRQGKFKNVSAAGETITHLLSIYTLERHIGVRDATTSLAKLREIALDLLTDAKARDIPTVH